MFPLFSVQLEVWDEGLMRGGGRKIPWRLSKFQKARQRKRLRAVDTVVAVVDRALAKQGVVTKAVERWKEEMPVEQEMVPRDKYTIFDRKEKKYRKSIRSEYLHIEGIWEEGMLMICRATQVDESVATSQSSWILMGWTECGGMGVSYYCREA